MYLMPLGIRGIKRGKELKGDKDIYLPAIKR
jgi:hypothetical protein